MKKFLKLNDKLIIRDDDKMLFSAHKMQIYKFNDRGFKIVSAIKNNIPISLEHLMQLLKDEYTDIEINDFIKKMIDNNIVIEYYE